MFKACRTQSKGRNLGNAGIASCVIETDDKLQKVFVYDFCRIDEGRMVWLINHSCMYIYQETVCCRLDSGSAVAPACDPAAVENPRAQYDRPAGTQAVLCSCM